MTDRSGPVWNRRQLLGTALAAAAAWPLAACGSAAGPAERNRLRLGFPTGGTSESLDPHACSLFVDQARAKALFDTLVGYADDMSLVPRLAESWTADATGTRWTIRLREAKFHNGAPVTAEDVLFSYRRIADPATGSAAADHFSTVDFDASRARDARELELVLHQPNFEFPASWGAPSSEIVPAGTTDFTRPIGSGPFRFSSFEPGSPAVFSRHDGYWAGRPLPTALEFVPINDENARLGALMSGQVHYAHDLSANSANVIRSDSRVRLATTSVGTMQAMALKQDRAPFSDPRLVHAIALGIDRQALVDIALSGNGVVGNDLFGRGLKYYPTDLPEPRRDVREARELVRAANADGIGFELHTGPVDPYFESASTLIAQQLGDIGMVAKPHPLPAETYFSDIHKKGVAALTRTAALPVPLFLAQRMLSASGDTNYTTYRSAEFDALYNRALATADERERARLLSAAQHLSRKDSGLLVWGFSNWNVGVTATVRGVRGAPPNSLDWARFEGVAAE